MVTPKHDAFMREYIDNFGGVYELKSDSSSCDRCSKRHSQGYLASLRGWAIPGKAGAPPYLCIDCARHFGLAW